MTADQKKCRLCDAPIDWISDYIIVYFGGDNAVSVPGNCRACYLKATAP